jgi:hypothetical protein
VAKSTGGSYTYTPEGKEEVKMGRGYDATRTFLKENGKIAKEIEKTIRSRFNEIQVPSAAGE